MSDHLRVLVVSHVPLVEELGGGRPQLEVAAQLRSLGHTVETFDPSDAFGSGNGWRTRYLPDEFRHAAVRFVREHGRGFDVIDAQQGDLPVPKQALRFHSLLAVRSVGFFAYYENFASHAATAWPDRIPGSPAGRALARWHRRRHGRAARRSFESADLALVPTEEEVDEVRARFGMPAVAIPHGLGHEAAQALLAAAAPAAMRLAAREVTFIGAWSLRKGAGDWGRILSLTRSRVPDVRFRFLGTGRGADEVHRDVGLEHADAVSVVPHFDPPELPELLSGTTVGSLPSYAEGWPFAVLEQLAAGLPCVAYDIPGVRTMLRRVADETLVPVGDAQAFAEALTRILTLDPDSYGRLSERSVDAVASFRWDAIADSTLAAYADGLARLQADGR